MQSLDDIKRYILSKRPRGVIVDTNILLLLLIGNYKTGFIKNCCLFKDNGKNYTVDDFELLNKIVGLFLKRIIITPQIIAEISNLSITSNKAIYGNELLPYIQSVVNILKNVEEQHQQAQCLWGMHLTTLSKFGFTDLTIYELSKRTKIPVLTDELNLHIYLEQNGIPNIKFQTIKNSQMKYTLI